jgi:hypothetical protein
MSRISLVWEAVRKTAVTGSDSPARLHRPEANRNEAASSVVLFVQLHIRTDVRVSLDYAPPIMVR